jgi:polysaccharide export outer membrane protein
MIRRRLFTAISIAVVVAAAGALHGQASENASLSSRTEATAAIAGITSESSPALAQRYPRYAIQREDVLLLSFPLTPELNQTVTVQPDGFIDLQSAGSLHVQGMTVPQLIEAVKRAYVGVLHDPIVDVDLKDFQKPFFTVSGQVGKPGQYELRQDITVAEAIAVAGGMAPTAKTQIFLFHRASNDWYEVEKINIKAVFNGKKANEDATIKPGDMIYVPEQFISKFKKYVPYSINAGTYLQPNPF